MRLVPPSRVEPGTGCAGSDDLVAEAEENCRSSVVSASSFLFRSPEACHRPGTYLKS